MAVARILNAAGLAEYRKLFEANHIDDFMFAKLSDSDLKDIGIKSLGHRRLILAAIAESDQQKSVVERRDVVILFVDLVGSTELIQSLEAEEAYDLMTDFLNVIRTTVSAAGGTVERHLGDAIMAIFGAPIARGDEALRAAGVACALHKEITDLGIDRTVNLSIRIGLAYGNAIVRTSETEEISVVGPSVNLAARLSTSAQAGETLISDHINQSCGDNLELGSIRTLSLKGFEKSVSAWPLIGVTKTPRNQTFGRESEVRFFETVLADLRASKHGRMVILRGEAGIGKSCMLDRWLDQAVADGVQTFIAQVHDFGGTPARTIATALIDRLWPNVELERTHALWLNAICGSQLSTEASILVDSVSPEIRVKSEAQALTALLKGYTESTPLVIAFEDTHWADGHVQDLIGLCCEVSKSVPLVVVATTRIEGDVLEVDIRSHSSGSDIWTIDLGPLNEDECRLVAESILGRKASVDDVIATSRGHPLYLEQLLRHGLEDRGNSLPHSIHSIVQARIDLLHVKDRRAARAAAILGQSIPLDALRTLLDDPKYSPNALLERRILQNTATGLQFHHALIHQSVYSSILREEREQFHRIAADWFQEKDLARTADHLAQNKDSRAAATYLSAAQLAAQSGNHAEAARISKLGRISASNTDDSAKLILQEANATFELNRPIEAITLYQEAEANAGSSVALQLEAQIGQVIAMRLVDQVDKAGSILARAEAKARAAEFTEFLSQILYLRGSLLFPTGDYTASLASHNEAYELAEIKGTPERLANALSGKGDAFYAQGRMQAARAAFDGCLQICERHNLNRIKAANLFMRGTVRIYALDWEGALSDAHASADLAETVGNVRAEVVSRLTAAWVLAWTGREKAAIEEAKRGVSVAKAAGAKRFEPFLNETLGHAHFLAGNREQAIGHLEAALQGVFDVGAERFIGPWVMGSLALALGPGFRQNALHRDAETLLMSGAVGHNHLQFRRLAIDAAIEASDPASARDHAEKLAKYSAAEPSPWSINEIERANAFVESAKTNPT